MEFFEFDNVNNILSYYYYYSYFVRGVSARDTDHKKTGRPILIFSRRRSKFGRKVSATTEALPADTVHDVIATAIVIVKSVGFFSTTVSSFLRASYLLFYGRNRRKQIPILLRFTSSRRCFSFIVVRR